MAQKAKKTEHTGAKHGSGAYWGPKKDAKKESNKIRRRGEKQMLGDTHKKLVDEHIPEMKITCLSGFDNNQVANIALPQERTENEIRGNLAY